MRLGALEKERPRRPERFERFVEGAPARTAESPPASSDDASEAAGKDGGAKAADVVVLECGNHAIGNSGDQHSNRSNRVSNGLS